MTILQLLFCAAKSNEIEQMNINHECCLRQSEKKTIYQFMKISIFSFHFDSKTKKKKQVNSSAFAKLPFIDFHF